MDGYIALVACYIFGAIPFGLIIGKVTRGIDIRDHGSGNIGASNVLRTLGTGPAFLVFFFDTVKGLGAVLLCKALGLNQYWVVGGALLSVLGHTFSIFLKFKGGKGVATALGVVVGLSWQISLLTVAVFAVVVGITRYISLGSITASVATLLVAIFWKKMDIPIAYQTLLGIAALAIILKHTSNIKRLINGTENKIGQKVKID